MSISFKAQCISISFYIEINAICRSAGTRVVSFVRTCVSLPSPAALSRISKKTSSLPSTSLCSSCEEQVDADEQQTRGGFGGGCAGRGSGGELAPLMTSALHWKWHLDAVKLMWLPSTFRSLYLPFFFAPGLFNFHWSFPWLSSVLETDAP